MKDPSNCCKCMALGCTRHSFGAKIMYYCKLGPVEDIVFIRDVALEVVNSNINLTNIKPPTWCPLKQ